jgi:predicted dehydrogenase
MIRLALIGCPEDPTSYVRIAPRLQGGQFTAVAGRDARAAARTAAALGADVWCKHFHVLFSNHADAFDAVVVRGPGPATAICTKAAAAGKQILIDGPLAESVSHAQELVAACGVRVRLMVGGQLRFLPSVRAVKEAQDAGRLGAPGLVRIHRWQPAGEGAAPDKSPASADRLADVLLRMTPEIDLACWLFGRRPASIYAARSRSRETSGGLNSDEFSYADYVQLHLGFPGGGMALIDHATLPPGAAYFSLSLIGSTGAAYSDDHHNMQVLYGGGQPAAIPTGQGDAALLAELQEFVSAVEAGREPLVTAADALAALQVAAAAAVSLAAREALRGDGERYTVVDAEGTT